MPLATTQFAVTDAAWVEVKLPFLTSGWGFRVEGGPVLLRGNKAPATIVALDAGEAVVDAGGGLVTIKATGHGLTEGDVFHIPAGQTANYTDVTDALVINAASDANNLTFEATYVAETIGTGKYVLGYKDAEVPEEGSRDFDERVPAFHVLCKVKAATGTTATLHVHAIKGS